jgi:hypothetical protein
MMPSLFIQACRFIRKEHDDWEDGIIINEGEVIIDMDGKPVPAPIWNYEVFTYRFSVSYAPTS